MNRRSANGPSFDLALWTNDAHVRETHGSRAGRATRASRAGFTMMLPVALGTTSGRQT